MQSLEIHVMDEYGVNQGRKTLRRNQAVLKSKELRS